MHVARLRFRLFVGVGAIVAGTIGASIMVAQEAAGGGPPPPPGGTSSAVVGGEDLVSTCLGLVIPQGDTEVNVGINKEDMLATFEWVDQAGGHRINVLYADPTCQANPSVRGYVNDVLADDAVHQTELCSYLTRVANGLEPPERDLTVSSAQDYVSVRC